VQALAGCQVQLYEELPVQLKTLDQKQPKEC
jgi:hypothetical protein